MNWMKQLYFIPWNIEELLPDEDIDTLKIVGFQHAFGSRGAENACSKPKKLFLGGWFSSTIKHVKETTS